MTTIQHQIPGRIRFFTAGPGALTALAERVAPLADDADIDIDLSFNQRTGRALATFPPCEDLTRRIAEVIESMAAIAAEDAPAALPAAPAAPATSSGSTPCRLSDPGDASACALPAVADSPEYEGPGNPFWIIARKVGAFYLNRLLMPMWLRPWWTAINVSPLILDGVKSLARGKLNVSVLDAAAIGSALAMRDFNTAGTVHLLLDVSETLEDWTKEKSREDLAALFRGDDKPAWVLRKGETVQVPLSELNAGDLVVVRSGSRIPVDGVVADGTAMVNQSSMTGEPLPVKKSAGREVFAGTVVDEGTITILSEHVGDDTRFAHIARIIADSEEKRADIHSNAVQLADKIVPFSFLLAGGVYLVTRNMRQAATVLLADYSCAIKLATPLSVRAAMLESAHHGALVKGGKYLEKLAGTDAVVLDKTGTLTQAKPRVVDICPANGYSREFILRHAACLEEHFPHPVAEAVVARADEEGLEHDEAHAEVEYILAHGICSTLEGQRVLLGSKHFVHEDEGVSVDVASDALKRCTESGLSALYMAIGGKLAGVITIEDPLHPDAYRFIRRLENMGVKRIIMLTGDSENTARKVAEELEIGEFYAQVLPDEKTELVDRLKAEGHVVAMVGDGINDSAALTRADVGVSMKHGADIAREACDVMLTGGRLDSLMDSISLSRMVLKRIRRNFIFIVGGNTLFIGLGVAGIISPSVMALLHNAGTVATCAHSMRRMLPEQ